MIFGVVVLLSVHFENPQGRPEDLALTGTVAFYIIVQTVSYVIAAEMKDWTRLFIIVLFVSYLLFYPFVFIYDQLGLPTANLIGVFTKLFSYPPICISMFLTPCICLSIHLIVSYVPGKLRAYLDGFRADLERRRPGAIGISKVSLQTGTSHGGVPLPDGSIAAVKLDFEVIRRLGEVAREYGLAGAVQQGASTLPDELFHHFPAVETAEIHLATGFQNALYDNPAFPAELTRAIDGWCYATVADERKADQTDEQFVYTSRKKSIGPFKRELWDLAVKDQILADQATKIAFLFKELAVLGTRDMVDRYIKPVVHHRPVPDAVHEALAKA